MNDFNSKNNNFLKNGFRSTKFSDKKNIYKEKSNKY